MSPPPSTGTAAGIVPAKLHPPHCPPWVLRRARLLGGAGAEPPRLLLVCAPAGFGKTVLALDWLAQAQLPVAWLSLDALDNEPHRFFTHLAAALRTLGTPPADAVAALLAALPRSSAEVILPQLLTALEALGERVALVLDDLHHIEAPQILAVLQALLDQLRGGPRFVFLTRVDPPLALGRLRLAGALSEVREQELRFTPTEAAEFFARLLPQGLAPELVARVEERTEGWAAGLRMAAIALERAPDAAAVVASFAGSHRFVMDYLLEEALGSQDETVQRFLMETSILPRFTAAACAAVTGAPDAPRLLHEVERANLFLIALDDEHRWYRYHHLFAELLEFRLRRLYPERLEALLERASRWFEAEGQLQEAMQQAARMASPTRLLQLLDEHGYAMLARSEFAGFARWLAHVPEPLSQPYPMFLVALAWFRAQTERAPDLEALLAAPLAALEHAPSGYPPARREEARLHCEALRAFALRMADHFDEALATSERVLQQLPPGATLIRGVLRFNMAAIHLRLARMEPARRLLEQSFEETLRAGVHYLVLASLGHLGAVLAHTDGVAAARERLETAVAFAEQQRLASVPAFAIVLYQLAQVHFLADELEPARALLERAATLTAEERETDIRANVRLYLARVETAAGRFTRAEALLAEASALAQAHNVKPFATTLAVERARLAAARDGRLLAPEEDFPTAEHGAAWSSWVEAETLLRLQHALRLGRRAEAAPLAERLAAESAAHGRGVALCVARLALAMLSERRDARWAAVDEALGFAARRGYLRPLLELGEPLRALLEAAPGQPLSPESRAFARLLLQRFAAAAPPPPPRPLAEPLTEREREVLAHLATGASNKAIARAMFVSPDTIKTHVKHLYAKLGASSREQALERARTLGVAPPVAAR